MKQTYISEVAYPKALVDNLNKNRYYYNDFLIDKKGKLTKESKGNYNYKIEFDEALAVAAKADVVVFVGVTEKPLSTVATLVVPL